MKFYVISDLIFISIKQTTPLTKATLGVQSVCGPKEYGQNKVTNYLTCGDFAAPY